MREQEDINEVHLRFQLPENLKVKKFLAKLSDQEEVFISAQEYALKSYLDSFDWRLYKAGYLCAMNQSKTQSQLKLEEACSEQAVVQLDTDKIPVFIDDFTAPQIKAKLAPILEMRALLSLTSLPYQLYKLNILNKDQKTTVRVLVEEYEVMPARVYIVPVRGYDKAARRISEFFIQKLHLSIATDNILLAALKLQGRKPLDYSSKLNIKLDPDSRADRACKQIYQCLLQAIKVNEAGTVASIDSEFLHDFRVAIRRTRAGLSQLKEIIPFAVTATYREYFAWLGQITGHARDMDVYLLTFPDYQVSLPENMREALEPLHQLLKMKQRVAQKELAAKLKSAEYVTKLQAWEHYLSQPVLKNPREANALAPIKQVADKRIWKVYQRVLREGRTIEDDTPPTTLHELRKTCKKLRYLLEFFNSLYPEKMVTSAIKALKRLQEILGEFQDLDVQEQALMSFGEELREQNVATETFLAMGVLVQNLQHRQQQAREAFSGRFDEFSKEENQEAFRTLFASEEQ